MYTEEDKKRWQQYRIWFKQWQLNFPHADSAIESVIEVDFNTGMVISNTPIWRQDKERIA